jgi:hypothetical protein
MKNTFALILFCLLVFITQKSGAQSSVVVAGANGTGSGGSISYSVGQIDFASLSNTTNAGVQQAYIVMTLPVQWLGFTATKQGAEVLLQWETSNELNSSHFVVQRSLNGNMFDSIGMVAATGRDNTTTKYSLRDKKPNNGINYYRVKQVDRDGRFVYSAIATINFVSNLSITCYPNPTSTSLNIRIGTSYVKGYSYRLIDMNGRVLKSSSISNQHTTIAMQSLNPSSYILEISNGKGELMSFVIIKN